ncbi:hypothetical protein RRG08_013101 [Elysia crispata]|uniref:Uncharacterized protein n=1 Tax=Elysia crispata TaxID=231223 RepID=A0AAE1A078_9GAST|nr:hypothetical protein RRG08_013101 [Elysia crispata]
MDQECVHSRASTQHAYPVHPYIAELKMDSPELAAAEASPIWRRRGAEVALPWLTAGMLVPEIFQQIPLM